MNKIINLPASEESVLISQTLSSHLPIFIIGYMAAGKTTFGRALARRTGREFIDIDFRIEQRFHTKIPEIFKSRGEDAFRRMEQAMLREVGEFSDTIISCGGGTPCFFDNLDFMLEHGLVVWLTADAECIARRVAMRPGKRPLLDGLRPDELIARINDGLRERLPFYSRAHLCIDGQPLETREEIDSTIAAFLSLIS